MFKYDIEKIKGVEMKKLILVFAWVFLVIPCQAEMVRIVQLETNFGDIVIELRPEKAPITVDNFLDYVGLGFYDGLIFHRVAGNPAVIQAGAYDEWLSLRDPCEPIINESNNGLSNIRGTIAMARSTEPNSATSQFYINYADNPSLDYNSPNDVGYCVFGQVVSDMNVVDAIADMPTINLGPPFAELPESPVIIYRANFLGDLNEDYDVNFIDYSIFAGQWQDSGNTDPVKVTISDVNADDSFGTAVSICADYAIAGATGDDNGYGSACIFKRDGTTWTQQAKLTASDGEAQDWLGNSVSIGTKYAIVGAYGDDNRSGSAYIFEMPDGGWVDANETVKLTPSDGASEEQFGISVSISSNYAIVGAWLHNDSINGTNSGSAYIFTPNDLDPNIWDEQAKLTASDGTKQDRFGYSVSICGAYAIVGAIGDENYAGSAYIFKRDGTIWTQQDKLTASDGEEADKFGCSVSITGNYAIVGAYLDDEGATDSGSAYIFTPNDLDPNIWEQQAKLTASDGAEDDYFGRCVSITTDRRAIVGAYGDDNSSGSAYLFKRNGTTWIQQVKLTPSDADDGDCFGFSASISAKYAIVGAYGDDDNGENSGSAYIYRVCPPADLNGDCTVDYTDLAIFTDNWLIE